MLSDSSGPLTSDYDLAMLDLDGVVYIGGEAVPGAPEHLEQARAAGLTCAFVTNNAARTPATVAAHLSELGVPAAPEDVVTSAQAAASVLAGRLAPGDAVAVLGGEGLWDAVRAAGLMPVEVEPEGDAASTPQAVVTGYGPQVRWSAVMHAAVLIRDGLWWVASNTDMTIPTPFGVAPGHGVLVETLRRFAEVDPVVAGKPARPLLDETVRRVGGRRPLMIGDRLDTDIEGAHVAEVDSLLVLTGVSGLADLVAAPPEHRPTYLAPDLGGLHETHRAPGCEDGVWSLGGWRSHGADGRLRLEGEGTVADWWRCVASASWSHLDAAGAVVDTADLQVPPASDGR